MLVLVFFLFFKFPSIFTICFVKLLFHICLVWPLSHKIFFSYFNICEIATSQMMTCHSLIGSLFSFLVICKIMMYLIISGIWDSNVSYLGMWGSEWIQKMKYYYTAPLRSHLMLVSPWLCWRFQCHKHIFLYLILKKSFL